MTRVCFLMSRSRGLIRQHFRKLHHKNEPFSFSGAFSWGLSKSWRSDTLNSGRVRSNQGFACSERCSNWEWRRTARMQQQEKKKKIRLDRAAEPSRTTESLQHLITPSTPPPPLPALRPPPFAKQRCRKKRRRAPGWALHRCPRELAAYAGRSLLRRALLLLHTIVAEEKIK